MGQSLYETDFSGWAEEQARKLREAAAASNLTVDWENVAEEVEGLAIEQSLRLARQLRRLLVGLLKMNYSRDDSERRSWIDDVVGGRSEVGILTDGDRTLAARLPSILDDERPRAVRLASGWLADHGEEAAAREVVASGCQYSVKDVLDDCWFPLRTQRVP